MNKYKIVRWLKGGLWYKTEEYGWIGYEDIKILWKNPTLTTILKTEYHG